MSNINIPTQVSPFDNATQFPAIGKIRVIYIDKATDTAYYWNDDTSAYVSLGGGTSAINWGDIGGNILDQTDLQSALSGKVDTEAGKGLSTNDFTTTEKNKLAGIQAGAEVNVNADWNATSGDAQILNKPTIPTAVTKTSDLTNDGADGINPFITAGDIPTFASADKMVTVGRNATGSTLYKGTIVYISGSTGNRPNFVKSQANAESTSAGTFGVIENDIPNNSDGNCVTIGTIENLDTRSNATHPFTSDTLLDGDTIYLSPTTAGFVTKVKPSAPNHMVYVGKVVLTSPTNGTIVYRIQNGYELDEIHDVTTTNYSTPQDVDSLLILDNSTSLWKRLTWENLKATVKTYFDTIYQTIITAGTTSQYYRGDKTWQTLDKTAVGLPNVDNTSDLNKPVSTAQATAINAKQNTLVSGTNIKTINGNSVLGSGNLTISGGGGGGIHAPKKPATGQGVNCSIYPATLTTLTLSNTRVYLTPFCPATSFNSASLNINVTTAVATSLSKIVIYSDNNGVPNSLLYASTDLDCSTLGVKTATTTFSFVAGTTYWLGTHNNFNHALSAIPSSNLLPISTIGTSTSTVGGFITASYIAPPNPIGSLTYQNAAFPHVWIIAA